LLRGHRQPGHRGRGTAADDLAQQHGHGILRVIGQRPVQRDAGQGSLAGLPGDESRMSLAFGHGASHVRGQPAILERRAQPSVRA
jgi:hypothetical protein